jgi:hypothetical protein
MFSTAVRVAASRFALRATPSLLSAVRVQQPALMVYGIRYFSAPPVRKPSTICVDEIVHLLLTDTQDSLLTNVLWFKTDIP